MKHRRAWFAALTVLVLAACCSPALGQEADADEAKALLEKGLKQFEASDFATAKVTLLKVDRDALSDADKQVLDAHLNKVDTAIGNQREARQALRQAEQALKSKDYDAAIKGFATAAASGYLSPEERRNAQARLKAAQELAKEAENLKTETATETEPAPAVREIGRAHV